MELNTVINGDCLEVMRGIPNSSVDLILTDLPYGTTKAKWDTVIAFDLLWKQYERIIKDNGAIVLFGAEPFASELRMSNRKLYKYDWYWKKSTAQGFLNAKKMPLKSIETISVFYKKLPTYNPQGLVPFGKEMKNSKAKKDNTDYVTGQNGGNFKADNYKQEFTNYPTQLLEFPSVGKPLHKTQKPVELFEHLIKTYTNEGEAVLDSCAGSGTTAIAAMNTNRNYILIEKEKEYFEIINKRISENSDGDAVCYDKN